MSKKRKRKPSDTPPNTLRRLARQLFASDEDRTRFVAAVWRPPAFAPALLWLEDRPPEIPFPLQQRFDWLPEFVDRVDIQFRPGQHPLHDRGAYYCLDCSSIFTASVLLECEGRSTVVIDLCASPGGKSMFAARALRPQRLVCNEVIGKRLGALLSNLQRCDVDALVTSSDPSFYSQHLRRVADLVIVDAPCSGQSLIAKGKASPGCFHPATINLNANRQRRILAHAAQVVAPHGRLAYITCTYAEKENERNLQWLLRRFPEFQAVPVPRLQKHQSHLTDEPCYRLWPFDEDGGTPIGAGGFCALLQRNGSDAPGDWLAAAASLTDVRARRSHP